MNLDDCYSEKERNSNGDIVASAFLSRPSFVDVYVVTVCFDRQRTFPFGDE
jgi:hypothetical protein